MKRISMLFLAVLLAAGYAYADSPRMILMEEFTNASCGPCASQNPTFQKFVEKNSDKIIPIAFHPDYPTPGVDIFYKHNPTMVETRDTYYGIAQEGVPNLRVNGMKAAASDPQLFYAGAPSDTNGIKTEMNKYTAISPVDITITETRTGNDVELNINVASSVSLVGKKLRIAAAEFVCEYPEGESAPNGEEHFFWVARKMFDNAGGSTIIDDNFSKKVELTMDAAWNPDNIYFIAWVQDDTSKEVLQAASTMKPTASVQIQANAQTMDEYFTKVKRGESVSLDFTVTNINGFDIDYNFEESSNLPTGWSATVSPATASIAAGGTATVTVKISSGTQAAFTMGRFSTSVASSDYFSYPTSSGFYALLAETKYIYYQSHSRDILYTNAVAGSMYGQDMASMPLDQTLLQVYPPTDFDCAIFTNYNLYTSLNDCRPLMDTQIAITEAMMALGKGVMLVSDVSGIYADQLADQLPGLNNFLFNKMGLEYGSTQALFNDQGQLYQLEIQGISGDPVTAGISYTLNSGASNSLYNLWLENFTIKEGSSTTPILKAKLQDGDIYTGFKMEDANKGRVIYISTGIEGNIDFATNTTLMEKSITWLIANTGANGPKVAIAGADENSLVYGNVSLNTPSRKTITISNDGSENLTYTLVKKGVNPSSFAFEAKVENTEYTVAPGESQEVTIIFTPTEEKEYAAQLAIATNDENNDEINIALTGTGVTNQVPAIDLASSLAFAETSEPAEKTIVLTNSGTGELNITSILLAGDDAAAFEVISNQSGAVAAGETFDITVRFTPSEAKDYAATLTVKSNIDDVNVAVTGKGASSVIDGWAGSVEFVSVNVGPNPVTETATVKYTVGAKAQMVDMYIVDANGNFVAQLVKENNTVSGDATTTFNVANMASGKYFIVANTGNFTTQLPFVIAK